MFRIVCLLTLMLWSGLVWAFPTPNVQVLPNGLTVVTVVDPLATISSSHVFVRTGSLFEAQWMGGGLSHYLEHLVAGGTTKKRPESEYRTIINQLGGAYNAYTTYDHTAYFIHSASNKVDTALQTLYEWMFFAEWTQKEYQREQGVIVKEIERAQSNMSRQVYQSVQSRYYKDSPYRYPVLGYKDTLLTLTSQNLHQYYTQTYVPENMVVVVGGNINQEQVLKQIQQTFGQQPSFAAPLRSSQLQSKVLSPSFQRIVLPKLSSPRVVLRYPIPSFYHGDVYALDLLAYVLGHGEQSVLYQECVVKRGIATSVRVSSITPAYGFGYFQVVLETDQPPQGVIQTVQGIIETYAKRRFKSKAVQAAIQQKQTEAVLGVVSLDAYLKQVGQAMMMGQDPLFFEYYANNFKGLTTANLNGAVAQYLHPHQRQSYYLHPKAATHNIAVKGASKQPQTVTMKPGITRILIPDSNPNVVDVSITLRGGVFNETPSNNGIGYLSAALLGTEAKGVNRNKFQAMFESRGASIGASMAHNALTYRLMCTTQDAPTLLPLFLKGLTQFASSKTVFDEYKAQHIKAIQRVPEDWFEPSLQHLKTAMMPPQYMARYPLKGTEATVSTLEPEHVEAYIQILLNTAPITVAITAQDAEPFLSVIDTAFQAFPERVVHPLPTMPRVASATVNATIRQPNGVVLSVVPIQPITTIKQWLTMQVVDAVVSGVRYPSGVLHTALRGQQLVYVVHTVPMKWGGSDMLFTYALTDAKNVLTSSGIVQSAFAQFSKHLTKESLALAKAQVLFDIQNTRQQRQSRASNMVQQWHRYGVIYSEQDMQKTLNGITMADVTRYVNANINSIVMLHVNAEKNNTF